MVVDLGGAYGGIVPTLDNDIQKSIFLNQQVVACELLTANIRKSESLEWNMGLVGLCSKAGLVQLNLSNNTICLGKPVSFCHYNDQFVIILQDEEQVRVFDLRDNSRPKIIKEEGWHCVWFCSSRGLVTFYFDRPDKVNI